MSKTIRNVGYIGLGNIGKPSARHLIGDKFAAHVFDVYAPAVAELEGEGAIACKSVAELAQKCEHIGICVRDDKQVEELLYAADGIFGNAGANTLIAVHSTVTKAGIVKWAQDAAANKLTLIDAPITGGASGAEAATLCYMVGGDEASFNKAKPVFETSGQSIIHAGALGTGVVLKLCNNLITYAEFMAMSEATRLADAGGLAPEVLREVGKSNGVVNESMFQFVSGRNAVSASCNDEQMQEFFGAFGTLAEKDLDCALATAADLDVALPTTKRLRKVVFDMFMNKA